MRHLRRALRAGLPALLVLLVAATGARAVEVQRVISPGGIEAWLVEDHSNPIVSLELAFRGGAALDPPGKAGLAYLASGLLDEGAGELDSRAFRQKLEDNAIRLSFDARRDAFHGSLQTLNDTRATAFRLLRLALTEPRFDPKPIRRIKSQVQAQLAREVEDPRDIAGRTFYRLVFSEHPYGRPVEGTRASVAGLTRKDLERFAATRLLRERLVIGVVGDITPEQLAPLLDATFGGLPADGEKLPPVPEAEPQGEGAVVVVEQDVPQSQVVFGHAGIKRDDPDYYAAQLVNYVLGGGGFASRLYGEVREKRGLAYSVYSYLNPMDHAALVAGGLGTANGRVAQALDIVRREWRRMAEAGPTAQELKDAKTYMTGSFPLNLSSTGRIAGMLVAMQLEELGIDYIDRRERLIEAVTREQARRVAAELYKPDALAVVVVGRPKGVEPTRPPPRRGS